MKKFNFFFFTLSLAVLSACGSGGSSNETITQDSATTTESALPASLTRGTMLLNLEDYFMPFSLYVPDSNRGIPNIIETGYGETEIEVGSTFHIVVAEGGSIEDKKAALIDDLMFKNEIVSEGPDYLFYKSVIENSHLEPEFHFYAVKHVDGIDFEFHDYSNEGGYSEKVAQFMLESINHLIANNSAS
jgi:hypothetical protein